MADNKNNEATENLTDQEIKKLKAKQPKKKKAPAKKKKSKAAKQNAEQVGRNSKYYTNVEPNLDLIKGWRLEGLNEAQIAKKLGVAYSTFSEYKNRHPELVEVLKSSKEVLTIKIKETLYMKALDGNLDAIKYYLNNYAGAMQEKDRRHLEIQEQKLEETKRVNDKITAAAESVVSEEDKDTLKYLESLVGQAKDNNE